MEKNTSLTVQEMENGSTVLQIFAITPSLIVSFNEHLFIHHDLGCLKEGFQFVHAENIMPTFSHLC